MKSYNNVTLIGRVVKNPDMRKLENDLSTSGDQTRTTFTLAVDRPYKDADGKHSVDFLNIVAWGKLGEICADYIKKGSLILIAGRIQSRSYEVNKETKWITEIVAESMNVLEYAEFKKGGE